MSLGGDTTTLDLCRDNPEWFAGYVHGFGHARQLVRNSEQIDALYTEYLSVLFVITGKTPTELLEEEE